MATTNYVFQISLSLKCVIFSVSQIPFAAVVKNLECTLILPIGIRSQQQPLRAACIVNCLLYFLITWRKAGAGFI